MKASGQSNILFVQPLSMEPSLGTPPTVTTPVTSLSPIDQPTIKEEVKFFDTQPTPVTSTREPTRTSPIEVQTIKQEKVKQTPKISKRVKEMVNGPGPRKKPNVLATYVGEKSKKEEEEEVQTKIMRGQISPLAKCWLTICLP